MKVYRELARLIESFRHAPTKEWVQHWEDRITELEEGFLPRGSGFDGGTVVDKERSKPDKLVLHTEYHHMNEGMYTRWTQHTVTVTPSLANGLELKVSGRNKNGIVDYIYDVFYNVLDEELDPQGGTP